jgi:hypothetical protein
MRMKRAYITVSAVLVWFALALQLAILIRVNLSMDDGSLARAIGRFLAYFTILSNILVACVFSAQLLAPHTSLGKFVRHPVVAGGVLMAIATVGGIYVAVLQQLWDPQGPQLVVDLLLHYMTPLAYAGYWLVFVPHGVLRWQHTLLWLAYPLGYAAYALLRGAVWGFYPYPFIDVATLGYGRVAGNIVVLVGGFVLGGLLLVALDRVLGRLAHWRNQPVTL